MLFFIQDIDQLMQDKKIFIQGKDRTDDILNYKCHNGVYWITFKDYKKYPYRGKDIKIIKIDPREFDLNEKFKYFKTLANKIGITIKNERGENVNILAMNYQKISEVQKETVLYHYLNENLPIKKSEHKDQYGSFFKLIKSKNDNLKDTKIYPFGFNISQNQAVVNSMENILSVIEGPPGTGKTQTILNIIANAIMHNESVAVVSSNNSATKNIIDKLAKYDVDFIAAYLGNNQNKQNFIDSQKPLPNIKDWLLEKNEVKNLYSDINLHYYSLKNMLKKQKELSFLKQQLSALEIENKHHLKYLETFENIGVPQDINTIKSCEDALELSFLFELANKENNQRNKFVEFLKTIIEFLRIKKFNNTIVQNLLKKYPKNYLIALSQQKFYEIKIKKLKEKVLDISSELEKFNFDKKMQEYSELSAKIFKSKLAEKYIKQKRKHWELTDLQTKSIEFIKDYPVVLSTTYSIRNCLGKDIVCDYVIVDEASQVDLCTGVLALSVAKKAVIVGDLKQLPNVVDSNAAKISDLVFNDYNKLPEAFRYKNHCLLSSIMELFPEVAHTLLKEHYRCHPMIIEFCNKKFYNNELIILSNIKSDRKPLLVYKTIGGNLALNNLNQRQIDVIKNEIIPNENLCIDDNSVGIVTPYRNQTNALQEQFKGTGVKADTVDKFQGQENKIIILSTVDNVIKDFTDNPNRLNVAVSRAIEQLIVVINGNNINNDTNIADLVKYIEYNNCKIKESKLFSIFDYLYECYAQQREELLKKYKKVSQYASENLFYTPLKEVILETFKNKYAIAVHIPINQIIKDFSILNKEELKYATNDWTHVDFLIYNKLNKAPTLAIEIDGATYHQANTKQAKRDILKNKIFEKYELPLLRFSTKDYVDKKIIENTLKQHIN